jgi:AcrR family transcriptional regulator
MTEKPGNGRRREVLELAAELFAEKGFRATTVRDIADAAGILSGSLYHHFDSKESMIEEILTGFLDELLERYHAIVAAGRGSRETLEEVLAASFEFIDRRHAEVAIYQNEAKYLTQFDRFTFLAKRNDEFRELWSRLLADGVADGSLRSDLDVELVYRFIRDTVWVAVRWYRPGGPMSAREVAEQYRAILLDGIAARTEHPAGKEKTR